MSSYPENLLKGRHVPERTELVCPYRIIPVDQIRQLVKDHKDIPVFKFSGSHVCDLTWNRAHQQAYVQGWHRDFRELNDYIFWFMNQFHDIEIIQDFHFKYIKRILTKSKNPESPERQKLTFTEYYYGMIIVSGGTHKDMDEKLRQKDADAIRYLERIYKMYFSPQNPKKDFECKAWIEREISNNNIHMHVVYKRKSAWLLAGKGWLKPSKKGFKEGLLIKGKCYYDDANILNALKYNYEDANNELIKDLCHEIKTVS